MSVKTERKPKSKGKRAALIVIIILAAILIFDSIGAAYKSNPGDIKSYNTSNNQISSAGKPLISAHRSGGGIAPEESLMAFKNCIENESFNVDIFEFDLHITKDGELILLHDDTLDRTTDSAEVFGVEKARPEDYTYEELRRLNIGAHFKNNSGEMPYAALKGEDVPDDLRIVRLDNVLDYLTSKGDFSYIIELKNGGELGKKGIDVLVQVLEDRNLLDKTVFGTFKAEITEYVDEVYPELRRSASIVEVLDFYRAAITHKKDFSPRYTALQIPYNMPYRMLVNLGTATVINYAHEHNIAVQYWTINKESELEYLSSVGADCIMSDYPDVLYRVLHNGE
jgi:glycerophosphoryl diester phosphodiesterase